MESSNELLTTIAKEEEIQNPKITIKPSYTPGEGFLGTYEVAHIHGKEKDLNLFLKKSPPIHDETMREFVRKVLYNEILFYETIYPEFVKFEKHRGCETYFKSIAKCYKTVYDTNKEVIVLDNMKMKGYKSYSKKETWDDAHLKLMLEEIAHFHAISFAFKDQKPEEFKKLTDKIRCDTIENEEIDFENTVEYIVKYALDGLDSTTFYGYKTYESFCNQIRQFLNSIDLLSEAFKVIIHRDLTNYNILFCYQDVENPYTPTNACILDWQLIRVTSPVIDLSYFFYGISSNKQMESVEDYLEHYYEKFCYYARRLGSDPNLLYPKDTFFKQWKILARYGLAMSFLVIKITLTEPEDIIAHQTSGPKKSMLESFSYRIKNENLHKERIQSTISHFIEKGFLEPLDKFCGM